MKKSRKIIMFAVVSLLSVSILCAAPVLKKYMVPVVPMDFLWMREPEWKDTEQEGIRMKMFTDLYIDEEGNAAELVGERLYMGPSFRTAPMQLAFADMMRDEIESVLESGYPGATVKRLYDRSAGFIIDMEYLVTYSGGYGGVCRVYGGSFSDYFALLYCETAGNADWLTEVRKSIGR